MSLSSREYSVTTVFWNNLRHRPLAIVSRLVGRVLPKLRPTILLLFGCVSVYIAIFGYLSLMKFYTFNDTWDLAIENQTLWLLSHGGISAYYSSGFSTIYPLQFEEPIIFLILPLYMIVPGIPTLLIIQTVALGCAAFPLFLFARTMLKDETAAVICALSYLLYFPLASANLFDFHTETFFPLFFFAMCYWWASRRPMLLCLGAVLVALINPLLLIVSVIFLPLSSYLEVRAAGPLARVVLGLRSFWADRLRLATASALVAVIIAYHLLGVLFSTGAPALANRLPLAATITYALDQKLMLMIYLLAGVAFLPIYRLSWTPVMLPYLAYVFYSTSQSAWVVFGVMYPIMAVGPLFFATILVLASVRGSAYLSAAAQTARRRHIDISKWSPRLLGVDGTPYDRMIRGLVISTIVFTLVYSPLSPINGEIAGGYFSGNHETAQITTPNADTQFLDRVIALIPPNGAVLTQNNIPQLSGREFYQPAELYSHNIPFDYILMDTSLTYFADVAALQPFVISALQNHTFGILAEGRGALLLERGYFRPPMLFHPFTTTYDAKDLFLGPQSVIDGANVIDNASEFTMWYGPYVSLYPGDYNVSFNLETNSTQPAGLRVLNLDVAIGSSGTIVAERDLWTSNFSATDVIQSFSLNVSFANYVTEVEFRGMSPSGVVSLTLAGVTVTQTS